MLQSVNYEQTSQQVCSAPERSTFEHDKSVSRKAGAVELDRKRDGLLRWSHRYFVRLLQRIRARYSVPKTSQFGCGARTPNWDVCCERGALYQHDDGRAGLWAKQKHGHSCMPFNRGYAGR